MLSIRTAPVDVYQRKMGAIIMDKERIRTAPVDVYH